jgi:hypothetical protein
MKLEDIISRKQKLDLRQLRKVLREPFDERPKVTAQVFRALECYVEVDTNHGAVHMHLGVYDGNRRQRTNQLITKQGREYYIEEHGNGNYLRFDPDAHKAAVVEAISDMGLQRKLRRFPESSFRRPSSDAILIYSAQLPSAAEQPKGDAYAQKR